MVWAQMEMESIVQMKNWIDGIIDAGKGPPSEGESGDKSVNKF